MWPFTKKPTKRSYLKPMRVRRYDSATQDRLTAGWNTPDTTADMEIGAALRILRNRSRDLERNNDYIRRYFNLLTENVVGHNGIKLQVRSKGGDGKPDKYANNLIEFRHKQWGTFGCTVCGRYTWLDSQEIVLRTVARDGETFIYFPPNYRGNDSAFAFQILEADYLDLELNKTLKNGRKITMGVEHDKYRRPIAYHFLKKHPAEQATSYQQGNHTRISAEHIIHLRRPERADETRSAPWITSVSHRLKQLSAAEEAEVVAWRIAASKMGFYIPGDDSEYSGDDEDEEGNPIQEAEPGFFEKLKRGWDFKEWNPDKPVSTVESFEKAVLRGIASGLNVSYVALANNLEGVSYSSIRSGELADRAHWRTLQRWLIDHFCQPVFERWLKNALLSQFVALPPGKMDKFNTPVWRPRGWEWVNPRDETTAAEADVSNSFRSLFDIAAERGRDLEEIMEENKAAKEMANSYGLILPAFAPKEAQNGITEEVTE